MHTRRPLSRLFCAAALALAGGSAFAQVETGTVIATVTDAQAEVLPGAAVTLQGQPTRTTNAQGQVLFTQVPPGDYTIVAEIVGFAPGRKDIVVSRGAEVPVGFILRPSAGEPADGPVSRDR
jgi:iron complex outermembrane recepter protein